MNASVSARIVSILVAIPMALTAQVERRRDPVMLQNWAAPLYWQPTQAEREASSTQASATASALPLGTNALVFVAMTPCRIADTRNGEGFSGAFGPPSLVGGATGRTFHIPSNTTCPVPSVAQAYSFNLSVIPPAAGGYITAFPTGTAMPLAATVIWAQALLVSNAAVVPAGTNGSVDVYASANTDLVIDINGYYLAPSDVNQNTALGTGALWLNTTGAANTAVGVLALEDNTTGFNNTASGVNALGANVTGGENTASGWYALAGNITGQRNTADGSGALQTNVAGNSNAAVGMWALALNTTGNGNNALGTYALYSSTTAIDNNAMGVSALYTNTTGSENTAIGNSALIQNISGSNNIAIGNAAAINVLGTNSNNIHIGSQGVAADNNTIRIGTPGTQTSFFAAGIRGVTTGDNDAVPVVIDDNGQLGTVSSSRRFKEDIQDMGETSSGLLKLRPVTFRYKQPFADGSKPVQYGLVAEEVAEVYPDLVAHSADGQIETVKYQVLDSMLLNELQKEHRQAQRQTEEIRSQAEEIRQLQTRLAALEQLLSAKVPPATLAEQ